MALLDQDRDNFGDAKQVLTEVLDFQTSILGNHHRETLKTQVALAVCAHHLGDGEGAISLLEETLERQRDLMKEDHPEIMATKSNLAAALLDEDNARAEALYGEIYQNRKEILGPDHELTGTAGYGLARALLKKKDDGVEALLLNEVLPNRYHNWKDDHGMDFLKTMNLLVKAYGRQGKHDERLALLHELYDLVFLMDMEDHPQSRVIANNLGSALVKKERFTEAENILWPLFYRRQNTLGDKAEETLITHFTIVECLIGTGQLEEARDRYEAIVEFNGEARGSVGKNLPKLLAKIERAERE